MLLLRLLGLYLLVASFGISGCATKKIYHGVEATNLSGLFYGMSRHDAELITGEPKREFQCDSGTIVTYVYDRGYMGCMGEGRCKLESETMHHATEIVLDAMTLGLTSVVGNWCITPCQKGHLELFFNAENRLIGARELPTDRDVYCWTGSNDPWAGYPCTRIYSNRRPSTLPEELILKIDPEDIPDKICDPFSK